MNSRKLPIRARLRHWHRRVGITAALFIIWLAVSGIVLNEGPMLGLDRVKIGGRFIATAYGLGDSASLAGFTANGHTLVSGASGMLLDGHLIQPSLTGAVGFVAVGNMRYIGLTDGLALLAPDGQLIEIFHSPTLPVDHLRRIGLSQDQRIVIDGGRVFSSKDAEAWSEFVAPGSVSWSKPVELTADQRRLADEALSPQFPLSRVLADAHSGRLFGRYGHWVVDAVGIAAFMLAISGGWIYLRAVRRQHH